MNAITPPNLSKPPPLKKKKKTGKIFGLQELCLRKGKSVCEPELFITMPGEHYRTLCDL